MDNDFETFDDTLQAEFISDLSHITGCPVEEMESVRFSPGCVIFDCDLDIEAVIRLIEFFSKIKNKDLTTEGKQIKEFCEKWSVTDLHSLLRISTSEQKQELPNKREDRKGAVVFVHGWLGSPDSFGEMPRYIEKRVNCSTYTYPYLTNLWKGSPALDYVSRNLDNWIRSEVREPHIAIFSHSMGGLVVRKFITLQFERPDRIDTALRQLTFIASPHNGSVLANVANYVPLLRKTQLRDLAADSLFLFSLNADWNKWVNGMNSTKCKIRSIVGTEDNLVAPNNAIGLDPNPVPILGAGHIDIVKPKKESDDVIRFAINFLLDAGFSEVGEVGNG